MYLTPSLYIKKLLLKSYNKIFSNEAPILNPALTQKPALQTYMAVEFISSNLPPWRAIQTRLKTKEKTSTPLNVDVSKINSQRIGPGFYSLPQLKLKGPRFSSIPRFSPSGKLKIIVPNIDRVKSGKRKKSIDSTQNAFSKTAHTEMYQSRLKSTDIVSQMNKILLKAKTEEKLKKIQKKHEKTLKWKANKNYINPQKSWFTLLSISSSAKMLYHNLLIKKKFKSAFKFNSSLLYQMSKCIGRLSLNLKKIKKNRALQVLGSLFVPLFHNKIGKLLTNYNKIVTYTIEVHLTRRLLKKLCLNLKRKINKLELGLKNLVSIYKTRIEKLIDIWNQIQQKYNNYSNKSVLSPELSIKIIRKYLLSKLKNHFLNQTDYRKSIREFKESLKQKISFRGELPRRKRGWRLTFALSSLPVLRVFNQDELIRIYLDEEQKSNSVKVERITE